MAGPNPTDGMDVRLLYLLCSQRPLRRYNHSFRRVVPGVRVSLCAIDKPQNDAAQARAELMHHRKQNRLP